MSAGRGSPAEGIDSLRLAGGGALAGGLFPELHAATDVSAPPK